MGGQLPAALSLMIGISCLLVQGPLGAETVSIADNDWAPYFFAGKKDEPEGLGKEMLKRCVPAGISTRFVYYPVKRMFLEFRKGTLDLLVMSYKKDREEFSVYGKEKLFSATYKPFVRTDAKLSLSTLEDFNSLRLGGLRGLSYSPEYMSYLENRFPLNFSNRRFEKGYPEAVARQKKNKDEFWMVGSNEVLIQGLVQKKIDTFVNTSLNVHYLAKKMHLSDRIREMDYVVKSGDYFLVAGKNSIHFSPDPDHRKKQAFLNSVDKCLKTLKSQHKDWIRSLYRRYGSDLPQNL